jgi:amino acid transporter
MNYFIKINVVSLLYALIILVPVELMVNVYRLTRLTGWEMETVMDVSGFMVVAILLMGTVFLYFITGKWMEGRRASYWTSILWFPYFLLFTYVIATFFPTTYGGDAPNPAAGLVLIGALVAFPIYVLVLNFLSLGTDDHQKEGIKLE